MNSRALIFARRNVTEILRSPVSWIFGLALPIGIFVIMQIVVNSIGEYAANVPMFGVDRFTGGVVIFGASFLSLFCAMLISGDRQQSFLARLFASPVRPYEYGVLLPPVIFGNAFGVDVFDLELIEGRAAHRLRNADIRARLRGDFEPVERIARLVEVGIIMSEIRGLDPDGNPGGGTRL